jgi:hypothetical protein
MWHRKPISLVAPLLLAGTMFTGIPAAHGQRDRGNFYNGVRDGGRNGNYDDRGRGHGNYDRDRNQGGIGPGKGALIGAGGGALLGGVLGGGLKGALIGGAAGGGIGAVIGESAQNNRRDNNYHRR